MRGFFLRHGAFSAVTVSGVLLASLGTARAQGAVAEAPITVAEPHAPIGISTTLANSLVLRGRTGQSTLLTGLDTSYAWTPWLSTFVRLALAHDSPRSGQSATSFANPAAGLSAQLPIGKHLTLTGLAGATVPVGSGGGNTPDPGVAQASMSGLDWVGTMFAVNHVDLFTGFKAAYTLGKATVQLESTLHELRRVRGELVDPLGPVATVTGSQATVSYAVHPRLTVSTAVFEARFWNSASCLQASPASALDYYVIAGASTNLTVAGIAVAPGVVYGRALDLPLSRERFQVVELDLGFSL